MLAGSQKDSFIQPTTA